MLRSVQFIALTALFLIPFLPLYVADGMFFPFITGKGFAFRILVEIATIAWVVLALADKAYRPRWSWIFGIYLMLALWMFLADLVALNPHKAFWSNYERMDGWVTMIHTFLLFTVASSVLTVTALWRKWWLTFLGGSALVCGYGLLQIMDVFATHQGGRIDATFGNAAYLPAYLLFGIAIALWQGIVSKGWVRYGLFALGGIEVFILLFTATRGALFGLVGASVVCALLWFFTSEQKKGKRVALGIIVGIALLGLGFFAVRDTSFVHNSPTLSRLSSVFSLTQELSVRTEIWHIAYQGFLARPLTGYGHEGFNYVFNTFYSPSLFEQEQWFDRAHNLYLDWLIAGGAPALLLFLGLLLTTLVVLWRRDFSRVERIFITGALVAYGIQGVVVFDNLLTYVSLAMLLAYVHVRVATGIPFFENAQSQTGAVLTSLATIVIVAGCASVWVINIPSIQASEMLIRSFSLAQDPLASMNQMERAIQTGTFGKQEIREQMVVRATEAIGRQDITVETKQKVAMLALSEMGTEIAQAPRDARLRLQYAGLYRTVGDTESALRELDIALALSPQKQSTFFEKGATLWQAGRISEARDTFYTAYHLDTRFSVPAAYAAAGDIALGHIKEGETLLKQHFDETLYNVPNVVLIAYQLTDNTEAVLNILKAGIVASNGSPDSRFKLARFYAQIEKRYEDAIAVVEGIIKDYPQTASVGNQWLTELKVAQ